MATDYSSITIRKTSEGDYQKVKLKYEAKVGKKISGMDFFNLLVKSFGRRLNDNTKSV